MADLVLEIVEGPSAGKQVDLTGPIEIGREGVAIVLDDPLVSRKHARVEPADGAARVEDLGSLNGTIVNGNQINTPARLDPGDQLIIGVTVFQLRTKADVKRAPSAVTAIPPGLAMDPRRPDYIPSELIKGAPDVPELDPLLDKATKGKARTAPIAIFVVLVIAVLIYLVARR